MWRQQHWLRKIFHNFSCLILRFSCRQSGFFFYFWAFLFFCFSRCFPFGRRFSGRDFFPVGLVGLKFSFAFFFTGTGVSCTPRCPFFFLLKLF